MSYGGWYGSDDRGNSAYEAELTELCKDIPRAYATRRYQMNDPDTSARFVNAYDYPRKRPSSLKRVYAAMCCGSGFGAVAWAVGVAVAAALIVVLSVKLKVGGQVCALSHGI